MISSNSILLNSTDVIADRLISRSEFHYQFVTRQCCSVVIGKEGVFGARRGGWGKGSKRDIWMKFDVSLPFRFIPYSILRTTCHDLTGYHRRPEHSHQKISLSLSTMLALHLVQE